MKNKSNKSKKSGGGDTRVIKLARLPLVDFYSNFPKFLGMFSPVLTFIVMTCILGTHTWVSFIFWIFGIILIFFCSIMPWGSRARSFVPNLTNDFNTNPLGINKILNLTLPYYSLFFLMTSFVDPLANEDMNDILNDSFKNINMDEYYKIFVAIFIFAALASCDLFVKARFLATGESSWGKFAFLLFLTYILAACMFIAAFYSAANINGVGPSAVYLQVSEDKTSCSPCEQKNAIIDAKEEIIDAKKEIISEIQGK